MDEYLWPARHVAEYAYCPRLFYLMEVEGVYLPNEETEAGKAVHKRVDRPSSDTEDEVRPKSVRSLTLTSDRLKLTATLDLAEIDGNHAIPVEYRKGRPKKAVMAPPPDDPVSDRSRFRNSSRPTSTVSGGTSRLRADTGFG